MGIRALEQHRPDRPLRVRHQGAVVCLPDPVDLTHDEILWAIQTGGRSLLPEVRMPWWKIEPVLERWLVHHGLGTAQEVGRLSWLVDKYEGHLTWDLQARAGVDLGALWRGREYHRLLTLIDRIPSNSYYNEALSNDPEHSEMLAKVQADAKDSVNGAEEAPKIPLTTWSPEVAALTRLIDAVKGVQYTLAAVNSEKGKAPNPPDPEPRPTTLLQKFTEREERRRRQRNHETLAARLLPHKRGKQDT